MSYRIALTVSDEAKRLVFAQTGLYDTVKAIGGGESGHGKRPCGACSLVKSRKEYNEYMRGYMLRRYHKRRVEMIEWLGGNCADCGAIENLEIDHIDNSKKAFDLSKCWNLKWDIIIDELKKCQLLCEKCHNYKSVSDHGKQHSEGNHGSLSVRGCLCERCRNARREWKLDK